MQWFTMKRQHAIKIMEDNLYFTKFKYHCMKSVLITPCKLNGLKRFCYLFAKKFYPETQDKSMKLFSNSTIF
ncbi:hypothetical protein Lal_00012510 [Lupinus albus]|nr:hypothetical protein Lal_00012510 [Lupinus albus]